MIAIIFQPRPRLPSPSTHEKPYSAYCKAMRRWWALVTKQRPYNWKTDDDWPR